MARNAELSKMKVSALKKEARTVGVDQVRAGPPVWIRLGCFFFRGSVCFSFSFVDGCADVASC